MSAQSCRLFVSTRLVGSKIGRIDTAPVASVPVLAKKWAVLGCPAKL
jgi:hypothetical protein